MPALSITYYLNKRDMMMTPLRFLCFVWALRKHNNNNNNNPSVQESFGHQVTSYNLLLMSYLTHTYLTPLHDELSEERGNYRIRAYLSSTQHKTSTPNSFGADSSQMIFTYINSRSLESTPVSNELQKYSA